ncbi:MAG: hypothetical protein MAG795_01148 [Candidatus Woesearchaeota archaeon]|nr:hypothetical protein [Candidatus Woesearchaeota archaeon]
MAQEYEVKILKIDVSKIKTRLEQIGAEKFAEKNFKRIVYALNKDEPLDRWVRLRTDGKKSTLAYKHIKENSIGGTEEIEFEVSDFKKTDKFLQKIGCKKKSYQENKRIKYKKNNIYFDIDFWPGLKPYVEIESDSKQDVEKGVKLLGFSIKDATTKDTMQLYLEKGIDLNKTDLKF